MAANKTYSEQMNREYTAKLREILSEMPGYMTTFFRGIEQTTSGRTRLAYATDIRYFFRWLLETNPLLKDKTMKSVELSFLEELTAYDFEDYMDYLKLHGEDEEITNNERTIKRKMCALRVFYGYFHKKQEIQKNPVAQVELPKLHDKAIIRLDIDEVAKLLDIVETGDKLTEGQKRFHNKNKTRDLAIMTLLLGTGIRVSECVGLDINDIDFNNDRIKVVRKGGYESYVYFGDEVREALLMYLEERAFAGEKTVAGHENALFLSSRMQRMTVRNVEIMVKKYSQALTTLKKITPHKLRSTYGTNLYRETGDIYLVADVLGHKDVNTTKKHYAAIEDDRRRSAKDAVRLRNG